MSLAFRARRQADARDRALIRKAASICLSYPGIGFSAQLAIVERAVDVMDPEAAEPFHRFVAWASSQDPYDLAAAYVEAFDQHSGTPMYLTRWTAGDSRDRGEKIMKFIAAYRAAGYDYGGEELPDHLPVVLDFASRAGEQAAELGGALLAEHAGALEQLRESLARGGADTYAGHAVELIDVVLTTLPAQ